MPLYEYRCTQCGHSFEKIQHFKSEQETVCPKCGGKLERPMTAPALSFKGAGWYVNDYAARPSSSSKDSKDSKDSSEAKPAAESKPSGDSSSTGGSSSSESKPAATESASKPASTSSSSSTTGTS